MWNNHIFIFLSICLFFGFLFHNCAPLAEQGGFQETQISIFSSGKPKNPNNKPDDNGEEEDEDEKDEDEEKDEKEKNDDDNEDEDEDEKEKEKTTDKPGPEFFDSETDETGSAPVTRGLY